MKIVKAICGGEICVNKLEALVHGRMRNKHKEKIFHSLQGEICNSDRIMLKQLYQQYLLIKEQQEELKEQMSKICQEHFKK